VCTAVDDPRALPAADLAARWRAAGMLPAQLVTAEADPMAALDRALARAPGPVVVAGSLYLVGLARGHLVDDPDLRDPEPLG
jgi:folylpolyglutamate synthase/dihydropteroate synthase